VLDVIILNVYLRWYACALIVLRRYMTLPKQEAKDKYRYVWLRHSPREVQRMRVERDRSSSHICTRLHAPSFPVFFL
jgi:hypothetical protein